jgi:hypothetical protein
MEENFAEGNGWKFYGQSAACDNAAFYCFHKLRSQAVAVIESAGGRSDPDDGSAKHGARVTHRLGKRSAQVAGKIRIPVAGESFIQIIFRLHGMSQRQVPDDRLPSFLPTKALCEGWQRVLTGDAPSSTERPHYWRTLDSDAKARLSRLLI